MLDAKTVGLIAKPDDPKLADTAQTLLDFLRTRGLEVLLDVAAHKLLRAAGTTALAREELGARCDLAIVIGGDGTLLYAARSLFRFGTPLIGVNRGRLGFLVDINPEHMTEHLSRILDGDYREEQRALLNGEIWRGDHSVFEDRALNDIVLHVNEVVRMIEFETFVDGRYLYNQRGDGLIICTPTGSTAYALSGGGPILHPQIEAVALVPICPHTLSNRPVVLSTRSVIEVVIGPQNRVPSMVSFDGQVNFELQAGDRIRVTRCRDSVRLIQPAGHDYFQLLRAKLKWSENP